jgi:colanic acid biosynthesis glycosyl transferase WcaI
MFSQYYPPEIGATQTRMHFFASRLAAKGHRVAVVAEVPNHPSGIIAPAYRRIAWQTTDEDGVTVVRVWVKTAASKTFWVRIAFYLTYALNATLAALLLTGRRYDAIFATSPPLTVGIPALLYSKIRRVPFVLDVRDLWPVLAVELGEMRNRRVIAIARRLELALYRHASSITVVTRAFERYLIELGCPPSKIMFLPNGTVPEVFHPTEPDSALQHQHGLKDRFVVGFLGNHGIAQNLEGVLDAAASVQDNERIRFVFVGEGPMKPALQAKRTALALQNVDFLPEVPQNEVLRYIALCDVLLVPLRRVELFKGFIPSKLFDFMACAKPVVLQVDGEAREILEHSGGGVFVPPGDSAALANAIRGLAAAPPETLHEMGRAGLRYVTSHFLREQQAEHLNELVQKIQH